MWYNVLRGGRIPMHKIGDVVKGKVTGIEDYGFFLLLDDGYVGLVHISEMSEKFVKNVFDYVQLGEYIIATVIGVDDEKKNLKLSIKNLNYRIEDKKELEDQNGFSPLRDRLPGWISDYEKRVTSE